MDNFENIPQAPQEPPVYPQPQPAPQQPAPQAPVVEAPKMPFATSYVPQSAPRPAPQNVQRPAAQPVPQNVQRPMAQPAQQPMGQPAPQPMRPPVPQPIPQPAPQSAPRPARVKKHKGNGKKTLSVILALAILIAACGLTAGGMTIYFNNKLAQTKAELNKTIEKLQNNKGTGVPSVVLPEGEDFEGELTPAQVYAMNVGATVAITSQGLATNIFGQISETASAGSGFIVSANGYVVTNFHVIEGANRVGVILSDGSEYNASLVGYDKSNDVAVLKIEGENFPYVTLGSSDSLVEGERVAAIGNPLGELSSTMTVGYVSAKDRTVNTEGTYQSMIQTDAAINSGNSGGPLFDMRGKVVGITTAKYSGTSSSGASIEGIGFAIPIDDVRNLIEDLCEFGHIKSGYLGIMAMDVDQTTANQYGLPLGALVEEVMEDSCAERAGIQAKDIITELGGYKVASMSDLTKALSHFEGGEEITVTVYRNGGEKVLTAVLDAKPVEEQETSTQQEIQQPQQDQPQQQLPGFYLPDWFNFFG